jgi:hypothetical protein
MESLLTALNYKSTALPVERIPLKIHWTTKNHKNVGGIDDSFVLEDKDSLMGLSQ